MCFGLGVYAFGNGPHSPPFVSIECLGRGNARRKSVPRFFLKLRNLQIVANKNFETKKIKKVPMNENEKRSFNFYLKITKIFEDKYKKQT